MSAITRTTTKPETTTNTDRVNVTRNKEVRAYLTERKALSATIKAGREAEALRRAKDKELLFPLLQGPVRFLVVLGQEVIRRTEKPVTRITFNAEDLQHGWPDAYEATKVVTEYHTLTGA